MARLAFLLALALFGAITGMAPPPGAARAAVPAAQDSPRPPIVDPQQLVAAYYSAFQAAVNSGDFAPVVAFFAPDAAIDSVLVAGGASGDRQILAYFQQLPHMAGFTVEPSNLVESDPYVDIDWRFRAAPGSLRGYLDGHDTFTIANGLIEELSTQADVDAVAGALMPPPAAPPATGTPVQTTNVTIDSFQYEPQVIQVPVGATVSWTNNDPDVHTATTDDLTLDSGLIEQDVTVSLTFPVAGTYSYYCTTHPGMRGKIIVGSP